MKWNGCECATCIQFRPDGINVGMPGEGWVKATTPAPLWAESGAIREDSGKAEMGLLPWEAIEEFAKVFTWGAKKYTADNWRKGFQYRRTAGSLLRHISKWLCGEDYDKESGLHHMAHAGCNVLMLMSYILTKTGTDDRWKREPG